MTTLSPENALPGGQHAAAGLVDWERRARCQVRPDERPVMYHTWKQLAFLHWRCDPDEVQKLLPPGLTVDTFDGVAWVGIVPFEMHRIRPVWSPSLPYISNFLELNLRTYAVDEQGTPGVWFLSLSANRRIAVEVGRRWFRLPYHLALLQSTIGPDGQTRYRCRRFSDREQRNCQFAYRPIGTAAPAAERSLEFFLVERYFLFSQRADGRIASGQVHHVPYKIQPVELSAWDDRLFELDGLTRPSRPPDQTCFVRHVDVEVFGLKEPHAV